MDMLSKAGRIFYGIAIAATGIQQFFFKDFFQIFFPPINVRISDMLYAPYLFAILLVIAGSSIALNRRTKFFSYLLGSLFLFIFVFFYIPFQLFFSQYSAIHLGIWINPLKEFAYSGGAFAIAAPIDQNPTDPGLKTGIRKFIERIAPFGRIMFAITMTCFGVSHFYYTDTVQNMVPAWIGFHRFWTYFAGLALIASGIAIIINFRPRLIVNLLGLMIFLWLLLLHLPGAMASPISDNGNEVTSMFSALAFSGIAFVVANSRDVHELKTVFRS